MSLAIQITGTKERIEEIGKRMILAQCHMGGTAIFLSETMLLYMPDDGNGVGQACDDLVKYDVYDPIQDDAVLVEADGTPGFVAGYQHGFIACSRLRQESVDALQRALTDAEQTLLDRDELISSLRAANAELHQKIQDLTESSVFHLFGTPLAIAVAQGHAVSEAFKEQEDKA